MTATSFRGVEERLRAHRASFVTHDDVEKSVVELRQRRERESSAAATRVLREHHQIIIRFLHDLALERIADADDAVILFILQDVNQTITISDPQRTLILCQGK